MLPNMIYPSGIKKSVQSVFGGLNHNVYARSDELYDMQNLTSDQYPIISTRKPRYLAATLTKPNGFYCHDDMYYVDGTTLYKNGESTGLTLTDTEKTIVGINDYIVILPDKKYYKKSDGTYGDIDVTYTSGQISFSDGTFAGVPAEANTITTSGSAFPFNAGDAVAISGCSVTENNISIIVREVSDDKKTLRFYEHSFIVSPTTYTEYANQEKVNRVTSDTFYVGTSRSFNSSTGIFTVDQTTSITNDSSGATAVVGKYFIDLPKTSGTKTGRKYYKVDSATFSDGQITMECTVYRSDGKYTESGAITLKREMPDIDYICECNNRLFGCKGDRIYASKLGDPFNWNVFDGLSTDSYQVDVGSAGDFTACISYLGYPTFFKENEVFKLYGNRPSNYQLMSTVGLGVDSPKSLAIVGDVLFYKSRAGIVAYSGGIPELVSRPLGETFTEAVGGSDGLKYYVSLKHGTNYSFYVFDLEKGLWHKEDSLRAAFFGYKNGLYCIDSDGKMWLISPESVPEGVTAEGAFTSTVEFGDYSDMVKTRVHKIQLKLELDSGASVTAYIKYDSGSWMTVKTISSAKKYTYYLPVIPRRCDHYRIKLSGTGSWKLHAIATEYTSGSPN